MFLLYLNNYNIQQVDAQYLFVFYEALGKKLDAHYVFSKEYLKRFSRDRYELSSDKKKFRDLERDLDSLTSKDYTIMEKPEDIIERTKGDYHFPIPKSPSKVLDIIVNCNIEHQQSIIRKVLSEKKIEAGILWVNNNCFKSTLEKRGIPVIHHELGPFRTPVYIPTVFFDYKGVNGNTEFDARFKEFLKVADRLPLLSRKELIKVLSPSNYEELWRILDNRDYKYEAGVGLQVEVDTNILLFNDGSTWIDPILLAKKECTGDILVRPHPGAKFILQPKDSRLIMDVISPRNRAHNFINKCKKIYCLNSSVGVEAMLLGREAAILGENPFRSMCDMDEDLQLKALNFTVFGYLVHRNLMFSNDYYRFRLKHKYDEELIYKTNLKYLIENYLQKG